MTCAVQGKHLVIGNVGDSRAVLGTKDDKGAYVAVQLTVDLKPNLPSNDRVITYPPLLSFLCGAFQTNLSLRTPL